MQIDVGVRAPRPTGFILYQLFYIHDKKIWQFDIFLICHIYFCYDTFMNYKRIYLNNYSYFITIVTHQRQPILVNNIDLLRDAFRRSKQRYSYTIDAIVILPEHLHMIITPKVATEYSKIISHIKRSFVYGLVGRGTTTPTSKIKNRKITLTPAKYKRQHAGIWQERFYEHTIRDEKDWLEKMEYIRTNPVKHQWVENVEDWEYSSFV